MNTGKGRKAPRISRRLCLPAIPLLAVIFFVIVFHYVWHKHVVTRIILMEHPSLANDSLSEPSTKVMRLPWYANRLVPPYRKLSRSNYLVRIIEASSADGRCRQRPHRNYNQHPVSILSDSILQPLPLRGTFPNLFLPGVMNVSTNSYDLPCPVPCKLQHRYNSHDVDLAVLENPLHFRKKCPLTKVGIASMESSVNYPHLSLPRSTMRYDFVATTKLDSDVPLVYVDREQYDLFAPAKAKSGGALAIAIISNCENVTSDRLEYIKQLGVAGLSIDFFGACGTKDLPYTSKQDRVALQSKYFFTLVFENSVEEDYVTEKLFYALEAGSVAVVRGAPNVKAFAPPNSVINTYDYDSPKQMVEYLLFLEQNRDEYDKYLEWKRDVSSMDTLLSLTSNVHSFCRACVWVKQVLQLELDELGGA